MLKSSVVLCTILLNVPHFWAQFTVGDPPYKGGGGFFRLGEPITGKCDSQDRYIEDHSTPCSGSGSTPFDTVPNVTVSAGGSFSINPSLRTYNIFCKIDAVSGCFSALIFDVKIKSVEKGFECVLKFSKDGSGGNTDRFPASLQWFKNTKEVKDAGKILTISNFTSENDLLTNSDLLEFDRNSSAASGAYRCVYSYKDMELDAEAFIAGELNVEMSFGPDHTVEQYKDDDTVDIICKAYGWPRPTIYFYHEGKPVAEVPVVTEDQDAIIYNLTISKLDDAKHRGEYKCEAVGADGSKDFATKTLHVRDKLAPLWPFIGIVIQVIVLVIVIAIGEKFRKKRVAEKKVRRQNEEQHAPGPSHANA